MYKLITFESNSNNEQRVKCVGKLFDEFDKLLFL